MFIPGIVSRYVDKCKYLSWLIICFKDESYNQSSNRYIDSNSPISVGAGVLMKALDSLLIIPCLKNLKKLSLTYI